MTIRHFLIPICAISLLGCLMSKAVTAEEAVTTSTTIVVSEPSASLVPAPTITQQQSVFFDRPGNVHAMSSIVVVHPELAEQLQTRKAGSVKFWEAVSWCETNHKWNDGGYFSGGLGMAQSVWVGYGGKQFAPRPSKATKDEQIIVANRVAFLGYQTKNVFRTLDDKLNNRPFFRPAVGWRSASKWGKNCVNWKTRKPRSDKYTEAGMAVWKKQREAAGIPTSSSGVTSAGVNGADGKSCPSWEKQLKAYGLLPVKTFSHIMWRESRCQEKVISKTNRNGSKDYGLLQINSSWKTITMRICNTKSLTALLDHDCNFKVAKYLLDNGGLKHWSASSGYGN